MTIENVSITRRSRTTRKLAVLGSIAVAGGLALTGCSTAEGLLAPNTEQLMILVSASNDVVLEGGHQIKHAPLCKEEKTDELSYSCEGKTMDDEAIDVVVPSKTNDEGIKASADVAIGDMTVTVGSNQVYSGPVQDVLDKNMIHGGTKP